MELCVQNLTGIILLTFFQHNTLASNMCQTMTSQSTNIHPQTRFNALIVALPDNVAV